MLPGIAAAPIAARPINAPAVLAVSPAGGNSASVTVSGTADPGGVSIALYNGGVAAGTTTADVSTGAWSVAGVALGWGANNLTAVASISGRVSPTSSPFTANFNGGFFGNFIQTFATNQTSVTYAAVPIGPPASNRLVAVGINAGMAANLADPNGVTIGGITATKAAGGNGGAEGGCCSTLWCAVVPSGTTADIVINVATQQTRYVSMGVWAFTPTSPTSYAATAPYGVITDNVSPNTKHANVNTAANGIVVLTGNTFGQTGYINMQNIVGVSTDYSGVWCTSAGYDFHHGGGFATGVGAETPHNVAVDYPGHNAYWQMAAASWH